MSKKQNTGSFADIVSRWLTPQVWKKAHQAWRPRHKPSRWTLPAVIWVLLGMSWCCGDSLEERFTTARAVYAACHGKQRRPGKSLSSFLRAMRRLPMSALRSLAASMREHFDEHFVEHLRINGWLPMACDGTRLECPRAKELQERLGICGKQDSAPMVYLTALVLLPLGLPWSWRWGKGNARETVHVRRLLATLPPRTLLVMDAYYQGYDLYSEILQSGASFLVRLSSRSCLYTRRERNIDGFREGKVYYWPEKAREDGKPALEVRALRVGAKRNVWLLTNLDRDVLSHSRAAQMYRWRWRNEGLFRQFKRMLKKTKLQSQHVSLIHREGEAAMLALQMLLAESVRTKGCGAPKELRTESPRQTVLHIRAMMQAALVHLGPRQWTAYVSALMTVRSEERPQRRSSRVRRKWPRRKEHKPPKPPNIRVLSAALKAKMKKGLTAA